MWSAFPIFVMGFECEHRGNFTHATSAAYENQHHIIKWLRIEEYHQTCWEAMLSISTDATSMPTRDFAWHDCTRQTTLHQPHRSHRNPWSTPSPWGVPATTNPSPWPKSWPIPDRPKRYRYHRRKSFSRRVCHREIWWVYGWPRYPNDDGIGPETPWWNKCGIRPPSWRGTTLFCCPWDP